MDAMIISVDEPQLERCVESVNNQTIPFDRVIHINNVCPEYEAFNRGMDKVASDWVMKVDGDFILYPNAHKVAIDYAQSDTKNEYCAYFFGLFDTFLDQNIGYCSVLRSCLYKTCRYLDKLSNDRKAVDVMRSMGWKAERKNRVILGTHFDDPDEFQVFKRFYTQKIKYPRDDSVNEILSRRLEKTGHPLYDLALRAGFFALSEKKYPGSHNVDFDREMFNLFMEKRNEQNPNHGQ